MLRPYLGSSGREGRARAKGFVLRGSLIPQRPRQQACDRIDDHHCRQLPTAQHEISNRYFLRR